MNIGTLKAFLQDLDDNMEVKLSIPNVILDDGYRETDKIVDIMWIEERNNRVIIGSDSDGEIEE